MRNPNIAWLVEHLKAVGCTEDDPKFQQKLRKLRLEQLLPLLELKLTREQEEDFVKIILGEDL